MKTHKRSLIVTIFSTVGFLLFLHLSNSGYEEDAINSKPINPEKADSRPSADFPTFPQNELYIGLDTPKEELQSRIKEIKARRPELDIEEKQLIAILSRTTAWAVDSAIADEFDMAEDKKNDGRSFIYFDRMKIETLIAGDTMDIFIPQSNEKHTMIVQKITKNSDDVITWSGVISDLEWGGQVEITQGKSLSYISIFARDMLHYTGEVNGSYGWIASSSELLNLYENKSPFIHLSPDEKTLHKE